MDSLLYRAAKQSGVEYGEFLGGIRQAMALCGAGGISEEDFIRGLVKTAIEKIKSGECL